MIQNKEDILTTTNREPRQICLETLEYALKQTNPSREIRKKIKLSNNNLKIFDETINLRKTNKIYVIGMGKASQNMAKEIEKILSEKITEGTVVTKHGYKDTSLERIKTLEAGHPQPDEDSLVAGGEILKIAQKTKKDDLVINLISGGGSSLLTVPIEPISLKDLVKTTNLLLSSGATINEINAVRKHISQVKGGRLAKTMQEAHVISLIVSDVVGDSLDVIASGPTVPDSTTYSDALKVLKKYSLLNQVPNSVLKHLKKGGSGKTKETPKKKDFENLKIKNFIISSNDKATEAAEKKGKEFGLNTLMLSRMIEGESKEAGIFFAGILKDIVRTNTPIDPPALIISGGETTVTLKNIMGDGGPNQEFVLGAAMKIAGLENVAVAAIDTDGSDGPTNVAGGIVDGGTFGVLDDRGIDVLEVLEAHNSKFGLEEADGVVLTGPTGTNVNDLRVGVVL